RATQPAALLPRALQGCVDFWRWPALLAWPRSLRISALRFAPWPAPKSTATRPTPVFQQSPGRSNMNDIITERSRNILRIQLNRPAKKNSMTSAMYITLADLFNAAAKDDQTRVVFWHGAGDSFSAGTVPARIGFLRAAELILLEI